MPAHALLRSRPGYAPQRPTSTAAKPLRARRRRGTPVAVLPLWLAAPLLGAVTAFAVAGLLLGCTGPGLH